MSDEITSQDTTEDVNESSDQTLINSSDEKVEASGPKPIYEDVEEKVETEESEEETKVEAKADDQEKAEEKKEETDEETDDEKESVDFDTLDKPEDSLLSDADMERIVAQSKEQGLSKEAAQKTVEAADDILKSHTETTQQEHRDLVEDWAQAAKDDKEIGGEKFSESVELAKRVANKFGTDKLIEGLNSTGFGNNPEVIRMLYRIGKAMDNDSLVQPGAASTSGRSLEDVFYGGEKTN